MIILNSTAIPLLVLLSIHISTTRAFNFNLLHSAPSLVSSPYSPGIKLFQSKTTTSNTSLEKVPKSTENFYEVLKSSERDLDAVPVQDALRDLENIYTNDGIDARISTSPNYDGDWFMETHPTFPDLQGRNQDGDALYNMGRLT